MTLDLSRHPCFNDKTRHTTGRIHLPVAPKCNVQCNFCNRRHDCANESRPGVTSAVLAPGQAIVYLDEVVKRKPQIAVVGIAGPGDPFANADETLETLRLVRAKYPEMLLCVASNGLEVAPYVKELAELDVTHVTMTINAVDPEIGKEIYAWIRHRKRVYRGVDGAQLLWQRQLEALRLLKQHDITVKVNTIIVPGVNDHHVGEVARTVAELSADVCNCVPVYPVDGTPFAHITPPNDAEVAEIRREAAEYLPLMYHCTRCRADAVGLLGESMPAEILTCLKQAASPWLAAGADRPHVAVATQEGVLVNQHLGEAQTLLVFRRNGQTFETVEARTTPPRGGGDQRWEQLAETLHDCRAVLTAGAGDAPCRVLARHGIRVELMEGLIEEGLEAVYEDRPIRAPLRKAHRCGAGCAGDGTGCM